MILKSTWLIVILTFLFKLAASIDNLQDKFATWPRHAFIEHFNNQNYTWKMTEYDREFSVCQIKTTKEEVSFPLERLEISTDLPKSFDSRDNWPTCETIREINDQGDCGSCWTFGSANTASDRLCIHSGIHVHLAEQDLECQREHVCYGGYPKEAFEFWVNHGLVSNKCKPYDIEKLQKNQCIKECVDPKLNYLEDKHHGGKFYRVSNETIDNIKQEIVANGPIEAGFVVYEDFMMYKSGIYEHKFGKIKGRHSVRVIGYGDENGVDFWLVANSWGRNWGENGLFRIKPLQELIKFEHLMFTGLPRK